MEGELSFVAIAAAVLIGTFVRPSVAVAGAMCMYGLKQWGQSSSLWFAEYRTFANFYVAGLVVLALALQRRRREVQPAWSIAWMASFLLLGYSCLTIAWTPVVSIALDQWAQQLPYLLLFGFLVPQLITSCDDLYIAGMWVIVIGAALGALALGFGQWGERSLLIAGGQLEDTTNPLAIAQVGGYVFLFSLFTLPHRMPFWRRGMIFLAISIAVALILRSGSRGQLIAALVAGAVGWPLASKRALSGALITLSLVACVVGVLGVEAWDYVLKTGGDAARWSVAESGMATESRWHEASLLLGHALGNPISALFGLGNSSSWYYINIYPHVSAMEVLAEEGLIGAILYGTMLAAAAGDIARLAKNRKDSDSERTRFGVAVAVGLFAFEFILTQKQGSLLSNYYLICDIGIIAQIGRAIAAPIPYFGKTESEVNRPKYPNLLS